MAAAQPTSTTRPDRSTDSERPLDERLVEAALAILADEGLEALTLRSVARSAGVSHGAPARHFRSLADLRAAVAARGFSLLSEAMRTADAQLPERADPRSRLRTGSRAYAECAVAHPALFALMFREDALDISNPSFQRESAAAFDHLLNGVRGAQATGWQAGRDARLVAGSVWAAIHGLASLWSQGSFERPTPGASLDDVLETTLDLFVSDPHSAEPPRPVSKENLDE